MAQTSAHGHAKRKAATTHCAEVFVYHYELSLRNDFGAVALCDKKVTIIPRNFGRHLHYYRPCRQSFVLHGCGEYNRNSISRYPWRLGEGNDCSEKEPPLL
ncbi:MAG: hypothetical protein QOH31_1599 [Verrucomicrobiota bacterium]